MSTKIPCTATMTLLRNGRSVPLHQRSLQLQQKGRSMHRMSKMNHVGRRSTNTMRQPPPFMTTTITRRRPLSSRRNNQTNNHTASKNEPGVTNKTKENNTTTTTLAEEQDWKVIIPTSFAIGTCAGIGGSLAGMGGGFVMIPLMTSRLLRLSQHQAHGTSLFAVAATGVAGALGYQGHVQYDAAAAIAVCGVVTAGVGASVTTKLSEHTLKRALGVFMILVAPMVPLKGYLAQQQEPQQQAEVAEEAAAASHQDLPKNNGKISAKEEPTNNDNATDDELLQSPVPTMTAAEWQRRLVPPALIGLGSGFLAGLFGVGGGAVVVPALTVFTDANHYQALGTSLCAMAFPAISGTMTHFRKGNVAMRVAPALAAGAFCGGYLGGRLGLHIDENTLRWGFSGLMITLGLKTLIR